MVIRKYFVVIIIVIIVIAREKKIACFISRLALGARKQEASVILHTHEVWACFISYAAELLSVRSRPAQCHTVNFIQVLFLKVK